MGREEKIYGSLGPTVINRMTWKAYSTNSLITLIWLIPRRASQVICNELWAFRDGELALGSPDVML
jgi:hypothetical protein